MRIEFSKEARQYIDKNGIDVLRIDIYTHSSCCSVFSRPAVFTLSPREDKVYSLYELEGIKIYVEKGIQAVDDLLIVDYEKYLDNEILTAENVLL